MLDKFLPCRVPLHHRARSPEREDSKMETTTNTTTQDECVLCGNDADERAIPSIHGTTCGDCVIMIEREPDEFNFARSWAMTAREFGEMVNATIQGWTDEQFNRRARLAANWNGAAEEMFWAGQLGQPVTVEMREAAMEAGERVLNA